ncbi:MAG TPA: putative maltokinase, partial [Beijerinckiaceae bacterium]|nr:putative maltokinase [Beijerinckiaceae bacterium]
LLCVANVSRAPQAVEMDLAEFRGAAPIELTAGSVFPQIGGLPYLLTLPGYGFYWFKLDTAAAQQERFGPAPMPELFTLVLTETAERMLSGRELAAFERTIAPRFLTARRWFAGKSAGIRHVTVVGASPIVSGDQRLTFLWVALSVELRDGSRQFYSTPLAIDEQREEEAASAYTIARVRRGSKMGVIFDADAAPAFAAAVVDAMRNRAHVAFGATATIRFERTSSLESEPIVPMSEIRRAGAEQSNTSIALGERMILKIYRRLQSGRNPEIEVGRFLTEVAHFQNTPELLGWCALDSPDGEIGLGVLQRYVRNQGDAWNWSLDALKRGLETLDLVTEGAGGQSLESVFADYLTMADRLGQRTGELHLAFATPTEDPAFASEPMQQADVASVAADARAYAERAFADLTRTAERAEEADRLTIAEFAEKGAECLVLIDKFAQTPPAGLKTRLHGDYHLGQVLIAQSDVMIVDFEGEPARTLAQRLEKGSPLRDVAGMLRSFAYVAEEGSRDVVKRLAHDPVKMQQSAHAWRELVSRRFLAAYERTVRPNPVFVEDEAIRVRLLRLHLLAKALYEIDYEANNRPDRISIPIRGVLEILSRGEEVA